MSQSKAAAVFGLIGLLFLWETVGDQNAWAAGNLMLGPVKVNPAVRLTEMFDNNVCRTKSEECFSDDEVKDGNDSITILSPWVRLELPVRDHSFSAEYRGVYARFASLDSEDYDDHAIRGTINLDFPFGVKVLAEEVYEDAHDPRGSSQNLKIDFYTKNTVTLNLAQEVGAKLSFDLAYTSLTINYDEDRNEFRDRAEQTLGGTVFYAFWPKTSALAELTKTTVQYDKSVEPDERDNTIDRILGGVIYNLTAKSRGTLKAGFEQKAFDDGDRGDFSGFIVSIELDHELTAKTLISLDVMRESRESNLVGQDYYISAGGSFSVNHRFTRKISATGQFSYGRDEYPDDQTVEAVTDERVDDTFRTAITVDYWIKRWLNVAGKIEHASRTSTFDRFEFTNDLYSITVGIIL